MTSGNGILERGSSPSIQSRRSGECLKLLRGLLGRAAEEFGFDAFLAVYGVVVTALGASTKLLYVGPG